MLQSGHRKCGRSGSPPTLLVLDAVLEISEVCPGQVAKSPANVRLHGIPVSREGKNGSWNTV